MQLLVSKNKLLINVQLSRIIIVWSNNFGINTTWSGHQFASPKFASYKWSLCRTIAPWSAATTAICWFNRTPDRWRGSSNTHKCLDRIHDQFKSITIRNWNHCEKGTKRRGNSFFFKNASGPINTGTISFLVIFPIFALWQEDIYLSKLRQESDERRNVRFRIQIPQLD